MLRFSVIARNPVAEGMVTSFGVVILAILADLIVGLWVFVAGAAARPDEDTCSDGLEALRHRRFVIWRSRKPAVPQGAVVAELEPTGESEPAAY